MGKKQSEGVAPRTRTPAAVRFTVSVESDVFEVAAAYSDGTTQNYSVSTSQLEEFAAHGLRAYLSSRVQGADLSAAFEIVDAVMAAVADGKAKFGRIAETKDAAPLVKALAEVQGITIAEAAAKLADKTTGFKLSLRREPEIAAALVKYETKTSTGALAQL